MNQQFAQQQSYGPPPTGIPSSVQNYPQTSKMPPLLSDIGLPLSFSGGFQTVPLGPSNPPPPQQSGMNKFMPPANIRPPASQLPPGQMPNPLVTPANQNGAAQQQHGHNSPSRHSPAMGDSDGGIKGMKIGPGMPPRQQLQDGSLPPPPMTTQNNMMPPIVGAPGGINVNQGRAGPNFPPQVRMPPPGQQEQTPPGSAHAPQMVPPSSGQLGMLPPATSASGPGQMSGQPPVQQSTTSGHPPFSENGPTPTAQSMFGAPPPPQQSATDGGPPPMFAQQQRPPVPGQQHQQLPPMPGQTQMNPSGPLGHPPMTSAPGGQSSRPTGQPIMASGQLGHPPMTSAPVVQSSRPTGQPIMASGQVGHAPVTSASQMASGQLGQPLMSSGPPGHPPMTSAPFGQPPQQSARPIGQPILSSGQPPITSRPPGPPGVPQMPPGQLEQPLMSSGHPPVSSGPPGQHQMSSGQLAQHQMSSGPPGHPPVSSAHSGQLGKPLMSSGHAPVSSAPTGQHQMSSGPPAHPPASSAHPGLPHMSSGQHGQPLMSSGHAPVSSGHPPVSGHPGLPQMPSGQLGQSPVSTGQHLMSSGPPGHPPASSAHPGLPQMSSGQLGHPPVSSASTGQHHMSSGPPGQPLMSSGPPLMSSGQPGPHQGMPRHPGMPPTNPSAAGGLIGPPRPGGMPPMQQHQGFNQPPPPLDMLSGPMQNVNLGGPPHIRQYPQMPQHNGTPMTVSGPTLSGLPHMPAPPAGPNSNYMNGGQLSGYPPQPHQHQQQQQYPGMPPLPLSPGQGRAPAPGPGGPMHMAGGPGGQQPPGGYPGVQQNPGMAYQHQQQQQQQKRLDPDQMPSQIQVTEDDQQSRSGEFFVNQKGLVPPLVTTNFTVVDQGHASPRYLRSTMYNIPISNDLMKQTAVPFGLVISPMARTIQGEYAPPCVDFGALGPVRCVRCKAYMGPYMQFMDSGRRFNCVFCRASTEVPTEYFQHLDHTGMRMDRLERPELVLGTYELAATVDYCRNNTFPKPPAFIFVIDVSYNSVKSGLVHLICGEMKQILKNLPLDQGQDKSKMRVGFITYDRDVHFYNIKGNLAAPQMLVVGDTHEMFMPLLDGFLCTPEESESVIDSLMEQIPNMFGETKECETILLPAITAGLEALKASECAGKLLVFHSTLPTAEAPGKLKNRDERKLLGTDKERTVLSPQTTVYNQLGQDCVASGCSVDLYLFNNAYVDIATIGQVARLTGGEVFKYTYFQADLDGIRLLNDVIMNISRPIAFDSIMRVRTSTGVRPTDFYGHFFMSNTTDIELAAIDSDKAIAVEVKHDDKLSEEDGVYIQVALLYTSCSGIRRLRIINQALKTCSQMADLYRSCDLDTIVNFFGKQSVWKLMENNPKVVKDAVVNRAAQMLANYRKNCANPSSSGQLILPECMKLLPLYVNCLLKSDAISGGADMTLDDRSFVMQAVMTMDVPTSVNYFYPRLLPLHEMKLNENGEMIVPGSIRCSIAKFTDQGVYILENGIHMFMWIGLAAYQDFVQEVFGVSSAVQVNTETTELPQLDNPFSRAVHSLINNIRRQRRRYMRLTLVRQREKLEPVFRHFLVEDQGHDNSPSYVDFLCHMHKEIRAMLS